MKYFWTFILIIHMTGLLNNLDQNDDVGIMFNIVGITTALFLIKETDA